VLFSGTLGARNRARIVELGNGWITHPRRPLDETADGVNMLRTSFEEYGRDPDSLIVRTSLPVVRGRDDAPDLDATLAAVDAHRAAGITDLTIWSNGFVDTADDAAERIGELGAAWARVKSSRRVAGVGR
jgi:alkanesulfonate monooxygenase SsuD/methylene tetrahydromethanopterin reductase-like flavin-dependent oxidoreductase (luciferase family)